MPEIQVPNALALRLSDWHRSMRDPIYAVSSSGIANRPVPKGIFEAALLEIERNAVDERHKDYINELREIALDMKGVLGKTEDSELREAIVRGMARTLWALCWADEAERRFNDGEDDECSLSGCDIAHIAPETPESVRRACDDAITQFLETNEISLREFYDEYKDQGCYRTTPYTPYDFGHEVIMSFAGYGGDFSFREYKKPYLEVFYFHYVDKWISE